MTQNELPGTAPITPAELAARKIAEPLKPKKPQQPVDFGLFGETTKQEELF